MHHATGSETLFRDDDDCIAFLGAVETASRRFHLEVHGYALIPNHYHLLIEIGNPERLSSIMSGLARSYVYYYHRKYQSSGHLWQGRYKSKPILKENYLVNCAEYIETNPIRKKITQAPDEYRWCSYKERCLQVKKNLLDELVLVVNPEP